MKKLLTLLVTVAFATAAFSQNVSNGPVTKKTSGASINDINEDLNIGSGRTVQIKSGGTLNGAGTFDFHLGTLTFADNQVGWLKLSKSGSSLADLATRSAADLSSGTLPDARFPSTLPALNGSLLTALNASQLSSGTLPDARFPATLPAVSGVNVTALNATQLTSGTVPYARLPAATNTTNGAFKTSIAADITNALNFAFWGDSLTAGSGGTPFPTTFATLTGFLAYNGGVGGNTSTQIATRMLADTGKYAYNVGIWAGRNNYTAPMTVKADIASMVTAAGHGRYLVLGVINGNYGGYERTGGDGYNYITTLNSDLAALYGSHYIDIRGQLIANGLSYNSITPTAQDTQDIADDIVPTSLRKAAAVSVTSITRSSTTATVTQTTHGRSTNDFVYVSGASQSEYNGLHQVTVSDANTYTYTVSGSPATPATGTITAAFVDQIHLNTAGYNYVAYRVKQQLDTIYGASERVLTPSQLAALLASPPTPIGSVSPNAGNFTTLSATGTATFGTATIASNIVTATAFQIGLKQMTLSGDASSFQFPAKVIPLTNATYDLGYGANNQAWRALYVTNTINHNGATASTVAYWDASKNLASAVLGSNITLTTGTLDTAQGIQTSSTPQFAGLGIAGSGASNVIAFPTDGGSIKFANTGTNGTINSVSGFLSISNAAGSAGANTLLLKVASGRWIQFANTSGSDGQVNIAFPNEATTTTASLVSEGGALFKKKLALSTYADGTLSVASGIVTSSSDARLKHVLGTFARGLNDIRALNPVVYTWRPESGIISDRVYAGFTAQNVRDAIPEAVSLPDSKGYLGVSDRPIIAALVNAVQQLDRRPTADWLARLLASVALVVSLLAWRRSNAR